MTHSMQVVCITDPVLATHVLRSKHVDKLRFQYSFLDPVSHPDSFLHTSHAQAIYGSLVSYSDLWSSHPNLLCTISQGDVCLM